MWSEIGRTARCALKGWGPTLRLIALLTTIAVLWLAVGLARGAVI